mgnify:CR=1 FL=1
MSGVSTPSGEICSTSFSSAADADAGVAAEKAGVGVWHRAPLDDAGDTTKGVALMGVAAVAAL